jgi:hypothetical protein
MKISINRMRTRAAVARRKGNTLIEVAIVLAIASAFLVYLTSLSADQTQMINAKNTADKMTEVTEGAKSYMTANYAALLPLAPLNGAIVIPAGRPTRTDAVPSGPSGLQSIQGAGFLPSSFVDTNRFRQRHALLVKKINARTLEAMVTTYCEDANCSEIPDRMLGQITNIVGPQGGYVPETYVGTGDAGYVVGQAGGWRTLANTWGSGTTRPQAGTIQATMMFEDGSLLKDYLYRNDIGVPEANRMNTNIDLNSKAVNNIGKLSGLDDVKTGARTVVIGADDDKNSLRATIDVFADRDVKAANDITAGNNITAQQTVQGNNVVALNNVTAGNDLVAGNTLQVNNPNGLSNIAGDLDVKGKILDVKSNFLSLDTVVYGSDIEGGDRTTKAQARKLSDFLPRFVTQYAYVVTETKRVVAKPTCRGGYGEARIMVYKQVDSNQTIPNVPLSVVMATSPDGFTAVGAVAQNAPGSWVRFAGGIIATDNGSTWTVNWVGDPAAPDSARQAVAQTFCFLG